MTDSEVTGNLSEAQRKALQDAADFGGLGRSIIKPCWIRAAPGDTPAVRFGNHTIRNLFGRGLLKSADGLPMPKSKKLVITPAGRARLAANKEGSE